MKRTYKFIGAGCLTLVVLAGLVGAGTCYYVEKVAMAKMFGALRPEALEALAAGHTEQQRERFLRVYDLIMIEENERLGSRRWLETYRAEADLLSKILEDRVVTVDESETWTDVAQARLEQEGCWR